MNDNQLAWAKHHDWYRGCTLNLQGTVTVYVRDWDLTTGEPQTLAFSDFGELYTWAGY